MAIRRIFLWYLWFLCDFRCHTDIYFSQKSRKSQKPFAAAWQSVGFFCVICGFCVTLEFLTPDHFVYDADIALDDADDFR